MPTKEQKVALVVQSDDLPAKSICEYSLLEPESMRPTVLGTLVKEGTGSGTSGLRYGPGG